MILRLYAMFERSRKVLASCLALIVLVLAAEGVIMYFAITSALGEHSCPFVYHYH